MQLTRRQMITTAAACAALPRAAHARTPLEIGWDDLIPPGVPYSEIIGEGDLDEVNDTWAPIFDENATKLNEALNGAYIRMPGFIIPIDFTATTVTSFVLVPYLGACIHTPPPPPNQLVFVTAKTPYPSAELWAPIWVTGDMSLGLQSTEVARTGYTLLADTMEIYEWE